MLLNYEDPPSVGPLRQGEILRDVFEHRVTYAAIAPARPIVPADSIRHALVVVLNNVCYLQWDFKARAEEDEWATESGVEAEEVGREAEVQTSDREEEPEENQSLVPYIHLCELVQGEKLLRRPSMNAGELKKMRELGRERYYCLPAAPVGEGDALPEFFIDFKKTFAMATPSLYEGIRAGGVERIAVVPPVYLQDLIQRYHAFHSRVGLLD